MEKVRKVVKRYYLRQIMTYWLVCWLFFGLPAQVAMAAPSGGSWQVGTGTIDYGPATDVIVNQLESVIEWGSLDTAMGESLTFSQLAGLSNSAVLNRVVGVEGPPLATFFDGTLTATDMRIFMINPAGILFGENFVATDLNQLVASGIGMSNAAFHDVLTDVTNQMVFDDGGSGTVYNYGTINATNSVYLVGTAIYNYGDIVCPGGLVVMAAGDTVKLGQPGSPTIVDLADFTWGFDNEILTSGAVGAQQIALGAGDIWASALTASGSGTSGIAAMALGDIQIDGDVLATATGASPAVATIDIVAGGDVTIDSAQVGAEAAGNGIDNATATMNIDAGKNVFIDDAEVSAYASDGVTNTATTNVTANDGAVEVTAYDDEVAEVYAQASDGVDNIANVNLTAKSLDTENPDNAYVYLEAEDYGFVYVGAEAEHAENSNSADVAINADYNVELYSYYDSEVYVEAYARYGAVEGPPAVSNNANITVNAGTDVEIRAEDNSNAGIYAEAEYGVDNTADVDVTANDGNVDVYAYDYSNAGIEADAYDAENSNTATVNVTASVAVESEADGDVYVDADNGSEAWIEAYASNDDESNTATVNVNADGSVEVTAGEESYAEIYAEASYGNNNTATIDIGATGDLNMDNGYIEADAYNTYSGVATAAVTVDAANVNLNDSQIGAEAYADEGSDSATATLDITMTGSDVIVDNDSWIWTYAEASDSSGDAVTAITIQGAENVTVSNYSGIYNEASTDSGSGEAKAAVDVDATGDVLVNGGDGPYGEGYSYIESYAYSDNSGDATATTTVDAANITVRDNGEIYADAEAYHNLSNAAATTEITTTSSEVLVEDDSEIYSYAYTEYDAGNAAAATSVDAGGVTVSNDSEIYAYAYAYDYSGDADASIGIETGGDVTVAENSEIYAEAYAGYDSGDADASIGIDAGGNVGVIADEGSSLIEAIASNGVTNTADVDVTANEGYVLVEADGGEAAIEAYTEYAYSDDNGGGDNTSTVSVTAKGTEYHMFSELQPGDIEVYAEDGGDAWIGAYAERADNTNTATVTIDAVGGNVNVEDNGYGDSAEIFAEADEAGVSNTAEVTVNASARTIEYEDNYDDGSSLLNGFRGPLAHGGNVWVDAYGGGHAEIYASAAYAEPMITSLDEQYPDEEPVLPDTSNTANVNINATGVEVTESVMVEEPVDDNPPVYEDVTYTQGGNVEVTAYNGHAGIVAEAEEATDNTAGVEINADGTVMVMDQAGDQTAEIAAYAEEAYNSNTADVLINANNVLAIAMDYGRARIKARAAEIMEYEPYYPSPTSFNGIYIPEADGTKNSASVEINANASETSSLTGLLGELDYLIGDYENEQLDAFLDGLAQGGHVAVGSVYGGSAQIEAVTYGQGGTENISDVLICADGGVLAGALDCDGDNGDAKIQALSHFGYSNTADVGISAPLGLGVLSVGEYAEASIASKAMYGYYNDASTVACTEGPALILGIYNYDGEDYGARIESVAKYGYCEGPYESSAYTGLCAGEDVIVAALNGEAFIRSEAEGYQPYREPPPDNPDTVTDQQEVQDEELPELPPTTADAETVVYSKRGIVAVVDYDEVQPATAGIVSEASNAELNSAYTGVVAGAELSEEPTLLESLLYDLSEMLIDDSEFDISDYFTPGSVYVLGLGPDGHAMILSEASDGDENTAETVVAAPGEVIVLAEDFGSEGMPIAQIKSRAGWHNDYESLNTAITRIYASEVDVEVPGMYRGNAIWAYAAGLTPGDSEKVTPPHVPYTGDEENGYDPLNEDGNYEFILTEYDSTYGDGQVVWTEENEETGSSATLIIQDYSERTDLPACPECPCLEEGPVQPIVTAVAPLGVAPLPGLEEIEFLQGGCPALMGWLANEVGVAVDVEVYLANAFVSSTDCQPCETAARLKRAATVLADEEGSHMAAMNQVFNEVAPANAPFTPEMANSIVTAFAGHVNDGTQYATAIEYIDAFVQYVAILNKELGSPVADSVAYVMEKYGSDIQSSDNENMAAFLAARIESGETFAQ